MTRCSQPNGPGRVQPGMLGAKRAPPMCLRGPFAESVDRWQSFYAIEVSRSPSVQRLDFSLALRLAPLSRLTGSSSCWRHTSHGWHGEKVQQLAMSRSRTAAPPLRSDRGLIVDAVTSERLGRIRQHNTRAEQLVRRVLHRMGLRFRIHNRDLPGSPDVANRARRWVLFVHGCFWHAHAGCYRATIPKRNRQFWLEKFKDNRARDARVLGRLRRLGYKPTVVWECETEDLRRLERRLRRELRRPSASARPNVGHLGSLRRR
jgi:DNA mismatch endonuclease (patch repair protein)